MKQKTVYLYIAAYLTLLIPTPGRFVYGFTLMLEMLLLMLAGTGVNILIDRLKLKDLKTVMILFTVLAVTLIFRQIYVVLYPEIMLTLGFIIYLVPVSVFLLGYLFQESEEKPLKLLQYNMVRAFNFALCGLFFCLIRDIAGYGTFTFYGKKHQIMEKVIFSGDKLGLFSFLSTIPGALVLCSVIIFFHLSIKTKFSIIENAEGAKE